MLDHVCAERYTFRERAEQHQSFNRTEFLRQKRLPETDRTDGVYGSHRLLRSCKMCHDRYSFPNPNPNVEYRKYRTERELVSAKSPSGRRIASDDRERQESSDNGRVFQINVALRASTPDSLVISDELDRGTSEVSGLSLVAAVLNAFAERGPDCPHVFLATHAYSVLTLLPPETRLIQTQVRLSLSTFVRKKTIASSLSSPLCPFAPFTLPASLFLFFLFRHSNTRSTKTNRWPFSTD